MDSAQTSFVICFYKGHNLVIYYDKLFQNILDEEKEMRNYFVEALKKVTDPCDIRLPKENTHVCRVENTVSFCKFVGGFYFVKKERDQKMYLRRSIGSRNRKNHGRE